MDIRDTENISLRRNDSESRYELLIGDRLASRAEFVARDGVVTFTHTETAVALRGNGLAARVVRFALDDLRSAGEVLVVAQCEFVADFIRRNPEFQQLLASSA